MTLFWSLSYAGPGWFIKQEEANKECRLSTELRRRREKNITKCHIKINVKKWYKKTKCSKTFTYVSYPDISMIVHDRYMIVT